MKEKLVTVFALLIAISMVSCFHHRGSTMITSNGDDYIEINYEGQVRFDDSETVIESISDGGYLKFRRNDKKLVVENNDQGGLTYTINDNGKRLSPDDPEGKRLIKLAVREMIAMGFDANRRMERLYKRGGATAVLDEVDNLRDDHLKSMYLEYLMNADSISRNQLMQVVSKVNSIGSDYEKANLLNGLAPRYIRDSTITAAYLGCVKGIGSDFDKSNLIRNIARQKLSGEQLDNVLDIVNTLGSDFEKQNCMGELINSQDISDENYARILNAIEQVGSDFEKQNLVNQLLDKKPIPANQFSKLIQTIQNMGSDFEKVNLFRKLCDKNIHDEQDWVSLIGATTQVGSDFDRSNLLVELSKKMPAGETVKAAYRSAAKSIGSDADYARAIREIN